MATPSPLSSGDGSRPTTDGGVDNIGAAKSFTPGKGSANAPAPQKKIPASIKDWASLKRDDSAHMGLTESTHGPPNTELPSSNSGRSDPGRTGKGKGR
jgi:hypothetical protein